MKLTLAVIFAGILAAMLAITTYASLDTSIFKVERSLLADPWFQATLLDAYLGFLTFYCWVFYKETSVVLRVVWLVAILLLGNIAMAIYVLIQLARLPAGAGAADLLLRRDTERGMPVADAPAH